MAELHANLTELHVNLIGFADGELSDAEAATIREHLRTCRVCGERLCEELQLATRLSTLSGYGTRGQAIPLTNTENPVPRGQAIPLTDTENPVPRGQAIPLTDTKNPVPSGQAVPLTDTKNPVPRGQAIPLTNTENPVPREHLAFHSPLAPSSQEEEEHET